MTISGMTHIYGIFGHPVSHSFSPRMHNAAFASLKLDCVYVAFDVNPSDLQTATEAIRSMSIRGVNVTIPHKQDIMNYLDKISPEAEFTGAVNTVVNNNGALEGYNTDVAGFIRALRDDLHCEPKGMTVTLLGAGGAARAVLSGLCLNAVKNITIINRTFVKAVSLAEEFGANFPEIEFTAIALNESELVEGCFSDADLLVNSTSTGMRGADTVALPIKSLKDGAFIYDLVYNPTDTELIKLGRNFGHSASSGLGMLIYQGAESFEIWTGEKAPVDVMRKAIEG